MNDLWKSATYRIVQQMKATGRRPGIIRAWRADVERWARTPPGSPDKDAVLAWLPMWQDRAVYTAAELAPLFPALAVALGFSDKLQQPRGPRNLANRLEFFRLPMLRNVNGTVEFRHPVTEQFERFFIVENIGNLSHRAISQEEFEHEFWK